MNLLDAAITVTLVMYGIAMVMATVRLFRGPRAQDRVVALDVVFVIALLAMLVLAIRYQTSTYFEAALLMSMFGFVGTAALAKFLLRGEVIE
jgi:multicomponent K+:H+ antiporter subunit F